MAIAVRQGRTFAVAFGDGEPWDFCGAVGSTAGPAINLVNAYGATTVVADPSTEGLLIALAALAVTVVTVSVADLLAHFDSPSLAALCSELSGLDSLQALGTGRLPPRSGAQTPRSRLPLFTAALGFAELGVHPTPNDTPQTIPS